MAGVALWNVGEEMKAFYNKESLSVFESDEKAQASLRSFNKQGVIDAHRSLALAAIAHERLSKSEGTFRSCLPSYMDKFCIPAGRSSKHLKLVGLADLELNRCNRGVALHGFLQVHPFRCSNVAVTAVEDDYGKAARLMAFNTLFWNSTSEDVHKLYPLGAEVLIKEPCLVEGEFCQGTSLWVPNPISLEMVSYFPQMQVEDPDVYLGWAGKELSKNNNTGAADLFTRCIRLLQHRLRNHELDHSEDRKKLVQAFASRAEAWMKLESYEKALDDAEEALALDPVDEKSLVAKGLALYGLSEYEFSSQSFKQALENSPSSLLEASYKASLSFSEQSGIGVYDFSGYYLRGCAEDSAPDVAEYVGPIEIRMSGEGRGRGLFLTRDVSAGEILLVSNAVALIFPDNKNDPAIMELDRFGTLLTAVLKRCVASPRVLAQVYACSGEEEVPDMELFQPNIQHRRNSTSFQEMELDVARVSDVLQSVNENGKEADVLVGKDFEGFWPLPGFLNHSCLPNVGVHRVGKALLVVASKNIKAGEELLRSYTSALAPWNPMRKQVLRFACRCDRCLLEEKLQEPLKGISERFDSILNATSMMEDEFLAELGGVAVELEKQMPVLDLTSEEQQWLRTSYCLAYSAHYTSRQQLKENDVNQGDPLEFELVPPAEKLVEALHSTAPGFNKTLMTMSCLSRYCETNVQRLLDEECISLVGKQKDRVARALLEQAMEKGKEFMW